MRFRHRYNGLVLLTLLLFVHMTEPNTAIKSSIVDKLLAARRENLRNRYAGLQSALVETLLLNGVEKDGHQL